MMTISKFDDVFKDVGKNPSCSYGCHQGRGGQTHHIGHKGKHEHDEHNEHHETPSVPIPSVLWLFLSGLMFFMYTKRKK